MRFFYLLAAALFSIHAYAHVKWFTRSTDSIPIAFRQLNHFNFWFLFGLSVVTIAALVYCERWLDKWKRYKNLNKYLAAYAENATVILRVFTGAALLLAWQSDAMIAPDLRASVGIGWLQFFMALGLLLAVTTPATGLAMIGLYLFAMTKFGFFHMLDYLVYPAIGYFLVVADHKKDRIAQTAVPALYVGLGFSLCWAALEKIFFPTWGLDVLAQKPALAMGLPHDFFLLACAFIELSLGYLLILGMLARPLALTITLVFFTTTAFFGKTEVIGHTLLHGALLVFIVLGPGTYYPAPIKFHKKLHLRALFAAVNFIIIAAVLGFAYHKLAEIY